MTSRVTEHCQPIIQGKPVSEEEMLRWEVERSRVALELLRRKLGPEGVRKLLEEECAESDQEEERTIKASGGKYVAATAEIRVKGLKAKDFLEWFAGRIKASDQRVIGLGCPEHYVVTPTAEGRMDVLETTGGWGLPTRFFVITGEDPNVSTPDPADIDPELPIRMAGRGLLRSGSCNGRILHQFAETAEGFKGRLTIYFPSASPPELIAGHRHHLTCEFTNWVNLCIESRLAKA